MGKKLNGVAQLVADPSVCFFHHFADSYCLINILFVYMESIRSFTTRHIQAILEAPLYIAVNFEPVMQYLKPSKFGIDYQKALPGTVNY